MLLIEPRFQLGPGLVVSSLGSTTTMMLPRNKLINHPSISIQIKEANEERKNRSKRSLAATRILPARPVGAMDPAPTLTPRSVAASQLSGISSRSTDARSDHRINDGPFRIERPLLTIIWVCQVLFSSFDYSNINNSLRYNAL